MERNIARKLVHPQCIALQLTIDADRLSGRQETRCPFCLGGYLERADVELVVELARAVVSRDADRPGAEIRFRDLRSEGPVIIPDAIAAFLAQACIERPEGCTVGFEDTDLEPIALLVLRSEEHTSELQSRGHLVCRLLLEKKKNHN